MQTGSPDWLQVLLVLRNFSEARTDAQEERNLHNMFEKYKIHNEWYDNVGELRQFIEKHRMRKAVSMVAFTHFDVATKRLTDKTEDTNSADGSHKSLCRSDDGHYFIDYALLPEMTSQQKEAAKLANNPQDQPRRERHGNVS